VRPGSVDSTKTLTGVDYYRLGVSVLMTLLGGIIVVRTLSSGILFLPLLVGGGFLFLGFYRLSFYYKYFKKRKI
jgi:hypothetical protein